MSNRHTKAPWIVAEDGVTVVNQEGLVIVTPAIDGDGDNEDTGISHGINSQDEEMSNAILISLAPELLAELKRTINILYTVQRKMHHVVKRAEGEEQ